MNHVQRLLSTQRVEAKNTKEAGKALEYFESIFGKRYKKGDINYLQEDGGGVVQFKDFKQGKCLVSDLSLGFDNKKLTFTMRIFTPYIDEVQESSLYIEIEDKTANGLIKKYKKEIKNLIDQQENTQGYLNQSVEFIEALI